MKNILLGCTLLLTNTFSDVSASITTPIDIVDAKRTNSATQLPVRPTTKYLLLNQDNHYYTNVVSNCDEYLDIIEQKDIEIEALKKEIDRLRSVEQAELQKRLKEEYDLKMKKFNERKSGIRTQNRMNISNEPVK